MEGFAPTTTTTTIKKESIIISLIKFIIFISTYKQITSTNVYECINKESKTVK